MKPGKYKPGFITFRGVRGGEARLWNVEWLHM